MTVETSATIELESSSPPLLPDPSGRREVDPKLAALGVLGEPGAQPRPLTEQRFVGDLHRLIISRKQAIPRESPKDLGGGGVIRQVELVQWDPTPGNRIALARPDETQEHRGCRFLLSGL